MNSFAPPSPPKFENIKYINSNYLTNSKGNELLDKTNIFYKVGPDNYRNIGTLKDIRILGQNDKILIDKTPVNMKDYADQLYILTGGYRKRKTNRLNSKRRNKRKTQRRKRKTQRRK